MQQSTKVLVLLAACSVLTFAGAATAKAKYTNDDDDDQAEQALPDPASVMQLPKALPDGIPDMRQTQLPMQQAADSFVAAASADDHWQSSALPSQQNMNPIQDFAQPRMQASVQTAFLGSSTQSEATAVISRLTEVVVQQSQALTALEQEQHQLAQSERVFSERSLDFMQSLAGSAVPKKCANLAVPAAVTDDASCDKACASQPQRFTSDGDWEENVAEGMSGWLSEKTYRCDCAAKRGGAKKTLCTDEKASTKRTTISILATLGMVTMVLHM